MPCAKKTGGAGMSAIAEILHTQGYRVSGSDAAESEATRRLASITADVALVGVNGLTAGHGLTTTNPEEAATKRAMLLAARRRVVPVIARMASWKDRPRTFMHKSMALPA